MIEPICRIKSCKIFSHLLGKQVFSTVIPRNIRLGEAPSHGRPILLYDIKSKGAESYIRLAKEIIHGTEKGLGPGIERVAGHAGS